MTPPLQNPAFLCVLFPFFPANNCPHFPFPLSRTRRTPRHFSNPQIPLSPLSMLFPDPWFLRVPATANLCFPSNALPQKSLEHLQAWWPSMTSIFGCLPGPGRHRDSTTVRAVASPERCPVAPLSPFWFEGGGLPLLEGGVPLLLEGSIEIKSPTSGALLEPFRPRRRPSHGGQRPQSFQPLGGTRYTYFTYFCPGGVGVA